MATLQVNAADVALVRCDSAGGARSFPAAAAIDAGRVVALDSRGRATSSGTNIEGIAVTSAKQAGASLDVIREGIVDLGDALSALAFGAAVYASPDGTLDDATGTEIGRVTASNGEIPSRKLLRVEV
ncbi:capsid cement protein [Rubrobacter calidifluminis]|uniref:capsid cement protein n=1 Tax=Rubrobacter calidifluminis TaxID=1392640 RepID=UPI002362C0F2|nr:capsid cement protein [Rubrobacter calidifluminis]